MQIYLKLQMVRGSSQGAAGIEQGILNASGFQGML